MPSSPLHRSLTSVISFRAEVTEIRPVVLWPFGLMLLGLAAALIAAGTEFRSRFESPRSRSSIKSPGPIEPLSTARDPSNLSSENRSKS